MTDIDPDQERQRLADLYAGMADEDLDKLLDGADELTDVEREVLKAEIERRGGHVEFEYEEADEEPQDPDLVTIAEFRDVQEAMFACGMLRSAGIESFLGDENTVRMNWSWSNMTGNMRLLVREEDVEAAQDILSQPIPEKSEPGQGKAAFRQPKCPNCGSLDVHFEGLDQGIGLTSAWGGVPLSLQRDRWKCNECGAEWRDTPEEPKFDA